MRTDSEMLTWLIREGNYSLLDHDAYYEYGEDLQRVVRAKIELAMEHPTENCPHVEFFKMTQEDAIKAEIYLKIIEKYDEYIYWHHSIFTMVNVANHWLNKLIQWTKDNMKTPEIEQFEMTAEGCQKATEYLKKLGKYDDFLNCTFSTDGYTLIATANYLVQAINKSTEDNQ